MKGSELWLFGLGCVLSTLFFLTSVSAVGSLTQQTVPQAVIKFLNFVSSSAITAFGARNMIKIKKSAD